ncbi:hypothetical protein NliqN6_6003 [Naganishia liquefaciens]|uniref:SGTA homodimerisation domain-containing protein n=1 Tax=Naganishia liquefaciens TaxID=104408 RepID=A0A8H3TZ95_9TREE|nr:hypothetical protein NliqN6_6003 [Naganishia liquefaciens]
MATTDATKQIAYSIIAFLRQCETDGSVPSANVESLQDAVLALGDAFDVDADSEEVKTATGLKTMYDAYVASNTNASASSTRSQQQQQQQQQPQASAKTTKQVSAADKARAESLKAEGNAAIAQRLYSSAVDKYSQAIALDEGNAVYWSNRAAAWGALGEHAKAVKDAERAVEVDAGFVRGWSRLGHAHYSLGNYEESIKAYTHGLTLDPNNANMKQALAQATTKAKQAEEQGSDEEDDAGVVPGRSAGGPGGMPDMSALAAMMGSMGGGAGGAGGPGGMPDLAGLMSNPAVMQMAQNMMANGGLERLMANPSMRNMAERMQSGGGMPDIEALRNDPEMRKLAEDMMGGAGGPGAGR